MTQLTPGVMTVSRHLSSRVGREMLQEEPANKDWHRNAADDTTQASPHSPLYLPTLACSPSPLPLPVVVAIQLSAREGDCKRLHHTGLLKPPPPSVRCISSFMSCARLLVKPHPLHSLACGLRQSELYHISWYQTRNSNMSSGSVAPWFNSLLPHIRIACVECLSCAHQSNFNYITIFHPLDVITVPDPPEYVAKVFSRDLYAQKVASIQPKQFVGQKGTLHRTTSSQLYQIWKTPHLLSPTF